jgi:anti-anti-sigma factor
MSLEIQIQKNLSSQKDPSALIIKLAGSLDTSTAPELERQLSAVLPGTVNDIVFDLEDLRFVSSAGLRIFSSARKVAKTRGGKASFIKMQPQIREVFEIMKALPGVAVFESAEELDRYLAARQHASEEAEAHRV